MGDDWARDPSVQIMRRVFSNMERVQSEFMKKLGISGFDQRLRNWRHQARALFERSQVEANRMGIHIDENSAAVIYLYCFANRLMRSGVDVPEGVLPHNPEINTLVGKVAP